MHGPWSESQDQALRDAVKSNGIKWESVRLHMKTHRLLNAIIKRWHCKVKFQQQMIPYQANSLRKTISQFYCASKKKNFDNMQHSEERIILWKKNWTDRDDKKLKMLVIQSGILNCNILGETLDADPDQIKLRWKKIIYPKMIKQSLKVGGALKWSPLEDKILSIGFKQNNSWEDKFRIFLPHRTVGSIEARWRRINKRFQDKQALGNKYLARRQWLKKMYFILNQQKKVSAQKLINAQMKD